jgi:SNF2 family DNA or RNA helicase
VAVTGTIIENNLGDLWSIFRFLIPGLFGGHPGFRRRFQIPVEKGDEAARMALKERYKPFLLRRTKAQVLLELPPKILKIRYLELPRGERELYHSLRLQALAELRGASPDRGQLFSYIHRLRQFCCHPALVYNQFDCLGARVEDAVNLLVDLTQNGHHSLVYSHFPTMLKRVGAVLTTRGIAYEYLDGDTEQWRRQDAIDAFQAGSAPVFLISRTAGGKGINLTKADHVLQLDPWWNPAVEDQAADRAHRPGQERPVTVYRYIAPQTVEEEILKVQDWKRELAADLLGDEIAMARVSNHQLMELIDPGGPPLSFVLSPRQGKRDQSAAEPPDPGLILMSHDQRRPGDGIFSSRPAQGPDQW